MEWRGGDEGLRLRWEEERKGAIGEKGAASRPLPLSPVPQLRQLDKRSVRRREIADKSVFRSVNKFLPPLPPVNERGKVFHLLRFSYIIAEGKYLFNILIIELSYRDFLN